MHLKQANGLTRHLCQDLRQAILYNLLGSEGQSHAELHQARLVQCRSHNTELRVAERGSRVSKLDSVEQVNEFRPELEIETLGQRSPFHYGEVPVCDAVSAQVGIGSGF